ncbi:hypothetical protein [Pendulispora albinea]|uniref:Nucleoside phosphorylase domain-containing protein n=1 Tax=Pendulispora albinea TaxID=2741071 RepID=A0ABZ2M8J8_9BACT
MLILAAFAPELAPFSEPYRQSARAVGIGLVTAAHATGALLASHPAFRSDHPHPSYPSPSSPPSAPSRLSPQSLSVLLVGSCGVYPARPAADPARSRPGIGSVIVAERVVLVDSASVLGHAAVPEPMGARAEVDRTASTRFVEQGCIPAVVGSTLGITTSDSLAHALAERGGADVENMEAYAVAEACAAAGVSCTVVLGVTNVVGSEGRAQWRQHHVEVAAKVAQIVERVLRLDLR